MVHGPRPVVSFEHFESELRMRLRVREREVIECACLELIPNRTPEEEARYRELCQKYGLERTSG